MSEVREENFSVSLRAGAFGLAPPTDAAGS
jgi:hypothetical protein